MLNKRNLKGNCKFAYSFIRNTEALTWIISKHAKEYQHEDILLTRSHNGSLVVLEKNRWFYLRKYVILNIKLRGFQLPMWLQWLSGKSFLFAFV
jgi:hypothetical protein